MCTIKQHPGKFEGESCITVWAYEAVLEGDSTLGDNDTEVLDGPFNPDSSFCNECHLRLLEADQVTFWEDDNGFAYSEVR